MKFYGQWDPPVDKVLFERYFPSKENGFFIECGAFDGYLENCCLFFEKNLNWTGINIEPAPHIYNLLIQNRPKSINLRVALSNQCGEATFKHAIHPSMGNYFGNGSLNHSQLHLDILKRDGCTFETYNVITTTYKKVVEEHNINHVDLFVLDVEGHELSVLDGMNGTNAWPQVFCIEYPNVGLDNLKSILKGYGYHLDSTSHNNAFFVC